MNFVQNSVACGGRKDGFIDTIAKEFPNIKIVANQYTLGTVEDARQRAVDLLTRFPDIDGIFAVNQPVSIGAYKAIQTLTSSRKPKLIVFDSDPLLLEGMEKNGIDAIIVQEPYKIGYFGVQAAIARLKGEKIQRNVLLDSMVVDPSNLAQMKRDNPDALGL